MIGAILGDMIGSPYEFDAGGKTKDFPLFSEESQFTDDTVMTLAVAQGFMDSPEGADDETIRENIVRTMHEFGQRYPNAGYGGRFGMWLFLEGYEPYNSFGNGSAMRVSPTKHKHCLGVVINSNVPLYAEMPKKNIELMSNSQKVNTNEGNSCARVRFTPTM